jgi:hypothetical protein
MRIAIVRKLLLWQSDSLNLVLGTNRCARQPWLLYFRSAVRCSVNCHSTKIWSRPGEIRRRGSRLEVGFPSLREPVRIRGNSAMIHHERFLQSSEDFRIR